MTQLYPYRADRQVEDMVLLTPPQRRAAARAFLRAAGPHRDPAGRPDPIPTRVLWVFRRYLGMTVDDVRAVAVRRGEPDPAATTSPSASPPVGGEGP